MAEAQPTVAIEQLRHDEDGRMFYQGRLFTGVAIDRWPNGTVASQVPFKDGIQHGTMLGWYSNGVKSVETPYFEGVVRGVFRKWHENGLLKCEAEAGERGALLSKREWDADGRLSQTWAR